MAFVDKLRAVSETIIRIEKKIGFTKFIQYMIFALILYVSFNFSSIIETVTIIQSEFKKQDHEKRLKLRDGLMSEITPLLIELRSETGASRVLYFEYHNSTENFAGIPFKYANLITFNQDYSCSGFEMGKYQDINAGLISRLYTDLIKQGMVINRGNISDSVFYSIYPGVYEFFTEQDGSHQQVFINLPGVNSPLGMIVLEWVDNSVESDQEWTEIVSIINLELPRINALIAKYTP